MVAPRAVIFRPLVKGNEDSGNEIGLSSIHLGGFMCSLFLFGERGLPWFCREKLSYGIPETLSLAEFGMQGV